MVKVPLKFKRTKKGGEKTYCTSQRGEETSRISGNAILDLTLVFGLVRLPLPLVLHITTG